MIESKNVNIISECDWSFLKIAIEDRFLREPFTKILQHPLAGGVRRRHARQGKKMGNKSSNTNTAPALQPVAQLSLAFNHSRLLTRPVNCTEIIFNNFLGDFVPCERLVWTVTYCFASFDSWRVVSIPARTYSRKINTLFPARLSRLCLRKARSVYWVIYLRVVCEQVKICPSAISLSRNWNIRQNTYGTTDIIIYAGWHNNIHGAIQTRMENTRP